MNIFMIIPRLCHGGAERVGVALANGFSFRGHHVTVVADLYEEQTYKLDSHVSLKHLYKCNNVFFKWIDAVRLIRKYVREDRPNVIIGIMELPSLLAWTAVRGLRIPVVSTVHNSFERPECAPMSYKDRFFKFHVNRLFDYVTVLTKRDAELVKENFHKVIEMPNPLAIPPLVDEGEIEECIKLKKKIIMAAGGIDRWHYKGFDLLIKAWGNIAHKYPDWSLIIAGVWRNEKNKKYLDSLVSEYGIDSQVHFSGFLNNMTETYKKASVFVLSSRYEAFGLVLIEAMGQGCACIACDYRGRQKEIIEDDSQGVLCPTEDIKSISKAMEGLIEDNEIRKNIQVASIKRSYFYQIDNCIDRWESFLIDIV